MSDDSGLEICGNCGRQANQHYEMELFCDTLGGSKFEAKGDDSGLEKARQVCGVRQCHSRQYPKLGGPQLSDYLFSNAVLFRKDRKQAKSTFTGG